MARNTPSVSEPQVTGETCAGMRSHQTRLPGETAAGGAARGAARGELSAATLERICREPRPASPTPPCELHFQTDPRERNSPTYTHGDKRRNACCDVKY